MVRSLPHWILGLTLTVGAFSWLSLSGEAQDKVPGALQAPEKVNTPSLSEPESKPKMLTAGSLRAKLEMPIALELQPCPLKEAVQFLGERFDLSIILDLEAFKHPMVNVPEADNLMVSLPKVNGIKLHKALHWMLASIQADFLQQNGTVVIVPHSLATSPAYLRQLPIQAEFQQKPLFEALGQLSDASGVTVVVDQRAAEQGRSPVTANFMNVELEAAVRILADMANLKAVPLGSTLYVTTAENAKVWQREIGEELRNGAEMP
jgi:hypothetical protein